jgi:hypothetical protein
MRAKLSLWFRLVAPFALLAGLGLRSQFHYVAKVDQSEVPSATSGRLISALVDFRRQRLGDRVVSESDNIILAKFESSYVGPSSALFPANDYFANLVVDYPHLSFVNALISWRYPGMADGAHELIAARRQAFQKRAFDMMTGGDNSKNEFLWDKSLRAGAKANTSFIETLPSATLLNRRQPAPTHGSIELLASERVRNRLVFIASRLGQPYYTSDREHVSLFKLEADYFRPSETMAGLGRYFLFYVVNPTGPFRVVIEYSASLMADGRNRIPPAAVIGDTRKPFAVYGRGSGRLFSPAIAPQMIDGWPYVALDLGAEGRRFPDRRSGLMRLYGRDVPLDDRELVGFGRDISIISDSDYHALAEPSAVASFPRDLFNKDLEYSGVYEDGWLAESSYICLQEPASARRLRIRARVARLNGLAPSEVSVKVDGTTRRTEQVRPGEITLDVPTAASAQGRHCVEVRFNLSTPLPPPDNRPVSALLRSIGFEE